MSTSETAERIRGGAPEDVQAAISWLLDEGYAMTLESGTSTFGAELRFVGPADVWQRYWSLPPESSDLDLNCGAGSGT